MSEFENEIAEMIIEVLNLEDISVDGIDAEAALFGEGLCLDSIDALELALVISQRYGFQVKADDADNKNIFSSLRALAGHIEANRAG
ncbi:MAG: acyl carrier protein [Gammaproteobacteria bacterium]|nr:acyl carrier protein [Gammaproteobacteria bacterium]